MDCLSDLLAGRLSDPDTGERLAVPVKSVVIAPTLVGSEAQLIASLGFAPPFAVVSDTNTHAVLGQRVEEALRKTGKIIPIRLDGRPHADDAVAARVMKEGAQASSYVAVGSGTINDLAKYAAAKQGKRCAVFATAPSMNGYTSVNVAITIAGHKKSLPAVAPEGIFIDLGVMAGAPKRLIRAGFGDAICRSTAQADWLLAHRLLDRPYRRMPFLLTAALEEELVGNAARLVDGDLRAIECLIRVLILSGFGMTIAGGSYPASQGEHLISHHLEMVPPPGWDEPYHGEQIAVTTLVMARLQERILARHEPPRLGTSRLCERELAAHFGPDVGASCWQDIQPKLLDASRAERLNARLASAWPSLRDDLRQVMRPESQIAAALTAVGTFRNYADLGISRGIFAGAVRYARAVRNRYTFLDLAADSGLLDVERLID